MYFLFIFTNSKNFKIDTFLGDKLLCNERELRLTKVDIKCAGSKYFIAFPVSL